MTEFKHVRLDGKSFTREEVKELIKEYNIKFIKLQFVDINGQVKIYHFHPSKLTKL